MQIDLADIEARELLPYRVDRPMMTNTVCLIVTNRCNISCDYCFNFVQEARGWEDMSPATAVGVLQELARYHAVHTSRPFTPHIIFFGGEPTLNQPVIDGVMKYINANHIDCIPRLVTNGVMSSSLLDKLIDEMFYFQVSYDGAEENLRHYKGSNVSPSAQVIRTLKRISQAGLPIFIRATIHAGNVNSMKDIVRFSAEHGAATVAFAPLATMGNALNTRIQRPDITAYVENYFAALEQALAVGVSLYSAEMDEFRHQGRPFAPPLVVLPDGQIAFSIKYASSNMPGAMDFMAGHFQNGKSEGAIAFFEERIRQAARNVILNQKCFCSRCSAFEYCRGRRMYDLFSANATAKEYDAYYCSLSRQIMERLPQYMERLSQTDQGNRVF